MQFDFEKFTKDSWILKNLQNTVRFWKIYKRQFDFEKFTKDSSILKNLQNTVGFRKIYKRQFAFEKFTKYFSHRVDLLRPLSQVEIIPMPYVTESTKVNAILPVTIPEAAALTKFLNIYEKVNISQKK